MDKTPWSEVVKRFNFYTKPVTLLLLKETGHRTWLGFFFTLIVISVLTLLMYTEIESLIVRDNPEVLVTEGQLDINEIFMLKSNNFALTVSSLTHDIPKYYDIQLLAIKKNNNQLSTQQIPLKLCSQFHLDQENLNEYFSGSTTSYCVDWDQTSMLQLQGSIDFSSYQYLQLEVNRCSSSSSSCLNQPISQDQITIKMTDSYSDPTDHANPNKGIGKLFNINIFGSVTKILEISLQSIRTETDDGYLLEDLLYDQSLQISDYQQYSDPSQDNNYLRCTISMNHLEAVTSKTYPKIQTILSDLGGFFEITYIILFMFIIPFNNLSYTVSLLNELFNFEIESFNDPVPEKKGSKILPESALMVNLDSKETTRAISKSQQKLKSIFYKTIQLEKFNRQSKLGAKEEEQKNQIVESISSEITQFFKEQESKLKLNIWDYFPCFSCQKGGKRALINYSLSKVKHALDITYIVKKLQEIDKLKLILLNQDQIKLFDYLPKPKLNLHGEAGEASYCSLMKQEQTDLQKALEAQKAFQQLSKHNDQITKKLMNLIDEDMIQLFKIQLEKGVNRSIKKPQGLQEAVNLLIQQNKVEKNIKSQESLRKSQSGSPSNSDSSESESLNSQKEKKKSHKKNKK